MDLYQIDKTKLATFKDLAPELQNMIFACVLDHEGPIDVTVQLPRNYQRSWRLQKFPPGIRNMEDLLRAAKYVRELAKEYIGRQNFTCNSEALFDLPSAFGPGHCSRILDLSMRMTWSMKCFDHTRWPSLIETFAKYLPNMAKLKIWSSYEAYKASAPYPELESGDEYGTVTRQVQEERAVVRLGCWIVLTHPTLNRVIKPADSGPSFELREDHIVNYVIVDKGYSEVPGDDDRTWESVERGVASRQERALVEVC